MTVLFDPTNDIIQKCMQGMALEEDGRIEETLELFNSAWNEAATDFERFIAAYHVARMQEDADDKLQWLETSLTHAKRIDDENVQSAYSTLYLKMGAAHKALGEVDKANMFYERSEQYKGTPTDKGPFYHGTKSELQAGDLLTAGRESNYKTGLQMNHIYFTANLNNAGLAAALAKGEGEERVYRVEPTRAFEHDPNVTDKKFPGNLTRSYRSQAPIKVIGEETDWKKLSTHERKDWREKTAEHKDDIIN